MNRRNFRIVMAERREFKRRGMVEEYRAHSWVAWQYLLSIRGVAPKRWRAITAVKMKEWGLV